MSKKCFILSNQHKFNHFNKDKQQIYPNTFKKLEPEHCLKTELNNWSIIKTADLLFLSDHLLNSWGNYCSSTNNTYTNQKQCLGESWDAEVEMVHSHLNNQEVQLKTVWLSGGGGG